MITDINLILADIQANWLLYLAMPFVAAAIGYYTKVVAIKMMFNHHVAPSFSICIDHC